MGFKGTVKGRIIELDEPIPLPDGTRVEVTVKPLDIRKNSPQAWLKLVGTLTDEEAEAIMKVVHEEIRRIDWEFWEEKES